MAYACICHFFVVPLQLQRLVNQKMLRRIAVYIVLLWSGLAQATTYTPESKDETSAWIFGLLFFGGVIGFFFLIWYWGESRTCPKCKKHRALPIANKVLKVATYSHGGNGERTYKCMNCGKVFVVAYKIPKRTHSSGSSSGGLGYSGGRSSGSWGGGSTSGGGAGGKW